MLSIGIVGLPNVGKSTLFNALTEQSVPAENYPFCTIDPSVGIVGVPDERLDKLSRFSRSQKRIPAAVEFTDIAGLVQGASRGEGLGNQFLANIREVDAIAEVVRVFRNDTITHVAGAINPLHDIEVINLELVLADEATVAKRLSTLEKEVKSGDKDAREEQRIAGKIAETLKEGKRARHAELSKEEQKRVRHLNLLTIKPILYVLNVSDATDIPQELLEFFKEEGAEWVALDIATERELATLPEEEVRAMREELKAEASGFSELVQKSYALLDLITFFTTGPKETRAWTVRRGARAPEAGAAIHSDFQDTFIRADVIGWQELLGAGSYGAAREKGLIRTEGKAYSVQDGDVIEFKI